MKSRILATAGLALSAALFLSACADTEENTKIGRASCRERV